MIIDVHSHLGDILNHNGGALIDQTGVKKKRMFDPISLSEMILHREFGFGDFFYRLLGGQVTRAERERNFTATLENMARSMDESGVTHTVCMPVPPYVTFEDLNAARSQETRVIPFTGIDFTRDYDIDSALRSDVNRGARGLKLHPIIQNIPLTDKKAMKAVHSFSQFKLPVLFHCGYSSYYRGKEKNRQNTTFGEIWFAAELVSSFPNVQFIAGHAGIFDVKDVIKMLAGYPNVCVDTSFQSPHRIRQLIKAFGPERVMFASDWPYGNRIPGLKSVRAACRGDRKLEEMILWSNAAQLLDLQIQKRETPQLRLITKKIV
jgi:predicted TIM-barrel fold metal-dependent hydrolase